MELIEKFVIEFINKEKRIEELLRKKRLDDRNEIVDELFMMSEGLVFAKKEFEPLSMIKKMTIEENKNLPVYPRHFYKISEYENPKYGSIWVCYVSVANPGKGNTKLISFAFIVAKINEDLKIIAQFSPDYDTQKWEFRGGDDDLKFDELGELVNIHRLTSPENDEWSVEEYKKEK